MGGGGNNPRRNQPLIFNNKEIERLHNLIPKDQYLCPDCGSIPQLINIYSDNGYIEYECENDGKILLKIDKYFEQLKDSEYIYYNSKCCICEKIQKDYKEPTQIFQYCFQCQEDYCFECYNNKKRHSNAHLKKCIPINEKKIRNIDNYSEGEYTHFCEDEMKSLCEKFDKSKHPKHQIIELESIKPSEDIIKIIREKNKILADLIVFNDIILQTYENFPNNYYHIKNVIKLSQSIEKENSRDNKEFEHAFKVFELKQKKISEAFEKFKEKFNISLTGKEKDLNLPGKGLTNEDLELLEDVKFSQLINIDFSDNNLQNTDFLKSLNTNKVKSLNLENNNINNIEALKEKEFPKLESLNISNNKIEDPSPLLELKSEALKLIKIVGNSGFEYTSKQMKEIIDKYTKKIITVSITFEQFVNKYNCLFKEDNKILYLRDKKYGNDILRDLNSIITDDLNRIEKLDIGNCAIDNLYLLTKVTFKNLKILDLSFNNIKSIEFVPKFKMDKLEYLYLNSNQISYISPLRDIKFNLKEINLKDNGFDNDVTELDSVLDNLKLRIPGIKIEIN